jgi:peptide-methionine (S)-S-oxide reductase
LTSSLASAETKTFVFSGGCFWCTEADFEKLSGVDEVISGFTAGTTPEPTYYPGKYGDHREAALVHYNPDQISFEDLVSHVYKTIDYEDAGGQFCDRGRSYSPAIYYKTKEEKAAAEALAPSTSIVPVEPEKEFFPVRDEHQDFYKKNKVRYNFYRKGCGRDERVKKLNG